MKQLINFLIVAFLISFNVHGQTAINFAPYKIYPNGGKSSEIAGIGDIDGNGWNDVVVSTSYDYSNPENDYKIFIYFNVDGLFQTPIKYPVPAYFPGPGAMHVTDMNNDGKADILLTLGYVGKNDSLTAILLTYSNDSLKIIWKNNLDYATNAIFGADIDNNGEKDIIIEYQDEKIIHINYQNNNVFDSTTSIPIIAGTYHDQILCNDINNDGFKDIMLMVSGGLNAGIYTWKQDNNYKFNDYDYLTSTDKWPNGMALGSRKNGKKFLAVARGGNIPYAELAIYPVIQNNFYPEPIIYSAFEIPDCIITADFDLDGDDDIAILHNGWSKISVYEQTKFGLSDYKLFDASRIYHPAPQNFDSKDLNGDGYPDIVAAVGNSDGLMILYNTTNQLQKQSSLEQKKNNLPTKFNLNQNYPNPFNPTTNIKFSLPKNSYVKLEIYNSAGELIKTLVNEHLMAGYYTKTLNAKNLASGIYFYRLQVGNFVQNKKMILLK